MKKYVELKNKLAIYVPSTISVHVPVNSIEVVNQVAEWFSSVFGGSTISPVTGCWNSNEVGLVKENINIVYSFADAKSYKENKERVFQYAERLKKLLKQESIAVEANNKLYLV